MPQSITLRLIKRLKPKTHPFEIRDTSIKGFLVRMQPSGRASFIVEYARGRRITLGAVNSKTLERARTLAKRVTAAAAEPDVTPQLLRDIVHPPESGVPTLREFLDDDYEPWMKEHLKTGLAEVKRLHARFPELLDRPLDEVTVWLIDKHRTARRKAGISPVTINRDVTALCTAFRRAAEWGKVKSNPLAEVKPLRHDDNARARYLSPAEEQRLRDAIVAREVENRKARERFNQWRQARKLAPLPLITTTYTDHLRPLVLLALGTGMRMGELFSLQWSDVDFGRRQIHVRAAAAKGGRPRAIPIGKEIVLVLRMWGEQSEDTLPEAYVFPGRSGGRLNNVKRSWARVVKTAKLRDFRFHDLRHTYASKLAMRGVDLNTVRELLGHKDLQMTLRYAHLAADHLADAVARLDGPAESPVAVELPS